MSIFIQTILKCVAWKISVTSFILGLNSIFSKENGCWHFQTSRSAYKEAYILKPHRKHNNKTRKYEVWTPASSTTLP